MTVVIEDDDKTVGFMEASSSVAEDVSGGMASVMARSALEAPDSITLNVSTGGTAGEEDYSLASSSVTIPQGSHEGTVQVNIADDDIGEGNETIVLTLSASESLPAGWSLGTTTHVLTIMDDENAVGFTVAMQDVEEPASADEDYSGGAGVLATQSPAAALTVAYEVLDDFSGVPGLPADATAATTSGSGADITFPASKTFTFAAGASGADLTQGTTRRPRATNTPFCKFNPTHPSPPAATGSKSAQNTSSFGFPQTTMRSASPRRRHP